MIRRGGCVEEHVGCVIMAVYKLKFVVQQVN